MNSPAYTANKIRLKTDLTHYHPRLISGSEGYAIGVYGQCSRLSKQYVGVWFPGIKIVDVNWAALEIITEQRRSPRARKIPEKRESFKMVWRVWKWMGF